MPNSNFFKTNKYLRWIVVAIVVIVVAVLVYYNQNGGFSISNPLSGIFGMSDQQIGERVINYINDNQLSSEPASLVGVSEESGMVKVTIKIGDQEFESYATKDGKILFPEKGFDMEPAQDAENQNTNTNPESNPEPNPEVTLSPDELTKFISCLKKADFVIYGANWCGWTEKLVAMLGGSDMVKPIYVECTENEKLCQEKGVKGYPTILVKGKEYQKSSRTFKDFAEATDCKIPSGAESIPQNDNAGGCQ